MSTEQQKCSICETHPEDILMVQCGHDLCVSCAAQTYQKLEKSKPNIFICEICMTETILDKQTVLYLQTATKKLNESEMRIQKMPPIPKPKPIQIRSECIQHKEEIAYYCFDCHVNDICAQCILSETHKNHHINTLKKAILTFNKNIENDLREKQIVKSKVVNQKKKLTDIHIIFKSDIQAKRKQIKLFFEELIKKIQNCQMKLNQQFQELVEKSQNSIKSQISRSDIKIAEIEQQIGRLNEFFKIKSKDIFKYKTNFIEFKPQKIQNPDFNLEFTKTDLSEELTILLNKIQIKKKNVNSYNNNTNISTKIKVSMQHNQIENTQNQYGRSLKKSSYAECTPSKPEMKRSLNLASDIINKLQSRQKNFE